MSKIEWTDKTWNPIIGCSKTSPACDHCYAERMAFRLACNDKAPKEYMDVVGGPKGSGWNGKTALVESVLEKPLHWRKPCRVFVGSMTDLFHDSTPFEWVDKVFTVMALRPQTTFQLLTKRPERMRKYLTQFSAAHYHQLFGRTAYQMFGEEASIQVENSMNGVLADGYNVGWPFRNVWLNVTVENQDQADKRIPILLDTPAAVRGVSVEPMIGPVDLAPYFYQDTGYCGDDTSGFLDYQDGLDWVICGGETGPGARPMRIQWVLDLQAQCKDSGVPFFFKKWGSAWGKGANNGHISGELCREFPTTHGW